MCKYFADLLQSESRLESVIYADTNYRISVGTP